MDARNSPWSTPSVSEFGEGFIDMKDVQSAQYDAVDSTSHPNGQPQHNIAEDELDDRIQHSDDGVDLLPNSKLEDQTTVHGQNDKSEKEKIKSKIISKNISRNEISPGDVMVRSNNDESGKKKKTTKGGKKKKRERIGGKNIQEEKVENLSTDVKSDEVVLSKSSNDCAGIQLKETNETPNEILAPEDEDIVQNEQEIVPEGTEAGIENVRKESYVVEGDGDSNHDINHDKETSSGYLVRAVEKNADIVRSTTSEEAAEPLTELEVKKFQSNLSPSKKAMKNLKKTGKMSNGRSFSKSPIRFVSRTRINEMNTSRSKTHNKLVRSLTTSPVKSKRKHLPKSDRNDSPKKSKTKTMKDVIQLPTPYSLIKSDDVKRWSREIEGNILEGKEEMVDEESEENLILKQMSFTNAFVMRLNQLAKQGLVHRRIIFTFACYITRYNIPETDIKKCSDHFFLFARRVALIRDSVEDIEQKQKFDLERASWVPPVNLETCGPLRPETAKPREPSDYVFTDIEMARDYQRLYEKYQNLMSADSAPNLNGDTIVSTTEQPEQPIKLGEDETLEAINNDDKSPVDSSAPMSKQVKQTLNRTRTLKSDRKIASSTKNNVTPSAYNSNNSSASIRIIAKQP